MLLVPLTYKFLLDFKAKSLVKPLFVLGISCFSILSDTDDLVKSLKKFQFLNTDPSKPLPYYGIQKEFLKELRRLNDISSKEEYCVYISADQEWYYNFQVFRPVGAAFVVPAYSGLAMVGGIDPSKYWVSRINGYSFGAYLDSPKVTDLFDAQEVAKNYGYTRIIEFKVKAGKLESIIHDI